MSGPLLTGLSDGASLAGGPRARRCALSLLPTRAISLAQVAFAPAVPTTVPSLLILGTDAVIAAAPATPVQLAHPGVAAGFRSVLPGSWGAELLASPSLGRVRDAVAPVAYRPRPYGA